MQPQNHIEQLAIKAAAVVAASRVGDDGSTASPSSTSGDDATIPAIRVEQLTASEATAFGATIPLRGSSRGSTARSEQCQEDLEQCAAGPVKDLTDVSHRLKKLEKAVKAHLLHGSRNDSSILSGFAGSPRTSAAGPQQHMQHQQQHATSVSEGSGFGSPLAAGRASAQGRLRDTLSGIKAEVADLAAREVEGQLLQQRVSHLESVINGLTGFAASGLGSFAGGGPASSVMSASPPRLTRAPSSDVSVLVGRLTDMEGLMKELAQAQVANTAVLQQIGVRLPTSLPQSPVPAVPAHQPLHTWSSPGSEGSSGALPGSAGRPQPARPPSCPLVGGILSSNSSPSPPRHRAATPDACFPSCHSTIPSGNLAAATLGSTTSFTAAAAAAPPPMMYPMLHPVVHHQQPPQQWYLGQPSGQHLHMPPVTLAPAMLQQQQQQPQGKQPWQLDVILAGHDAELADMRSSVCQLASEHQASANTTAAQIGSLSERVTAMEKALTEMHEEPAPGLGTQGTHVTEYASGPMVAASPAAAAATDVAVSSNVAQVAEAWVTGVADAVSIANGLNQEDVVTAIEGLAADAAQANNRLQYLEESNQQVAGQMQEVTNALQDVHAAVSSQQLQQQLLQQLLNSGQLQQLLDVHVQKAVESRLDEVIAVRVEQEVACRIAQASLAAAVQGTASSTRHLPTHPAAVIEEQAAEDEADVADQEACSRSACSSPAVPPKLLHAFDMLAEKLAGLQAHAAAGQAEVIHEAVQHLHNRLLAVEDLTQAQHDGPEAGTVADVATAMDDEHKQVPEPFSNTASAGVELAETFYSAESQPTSCQATTQGPITEPVNQEQQGQRSLCRNLSAAAEQQERMPSAGTSCLETSSNDIDSVAELDDSSSLEQATSHPDSDSSSPCAGRAIIAAPMQLAAVTNDSIPPMSSPAAENSFDLQQQVNDLQQEMTSQQLQTMQAAIEDLTKQMQSVLLHLNSQSVLLDSLIPLQPEVCSLTSQVVTLCELTASHPQRISTLQQEIEQLSKQLTEVNACAVDDEDLLDVKSQIQQLRAQQADLQAGLSQQLQAANAAATDAAAATEALAVQVERANTLAESAAAAEAAAAGLNAGATQSEARDLVLELEDRVQQQLSSMNVGLSALQQQVDQQVAEATAKAVAATAAAEGQRDAADLMSQQASELSCKLAALEVAVTEGRVAAEFALEQRVQELKEAAQGHDAELRGQLHQQVETMGQILTDIGAAKAEQAEATQQLQQRLVVVAEAQEAYGSEQAALQQDLTGQIQLTAQQLRSEFNSTLDPIQQQLVATSQQLAEQGAAIEGCAKSAVLAGVVATLRSLPGAVEGLTSRLDELAQTQRAAKGQLNAAQEHQLVLQGQLAGLQSRFEEVASIIDGQRSHLGEEVERLQAELLQPVQEQMQDLQEQKKQLQQLQTQQTAAVGQLGAVVQGLRSELMAELACDMEQLALAIDELQSVVTDRCIKTEQLGEIFAARDNMYGAWQKMQAVFESNRSHGGAAGMFENPLFKVRPSITLSRSPSASPVRDPTATAAAAAAAAAATAMVNIGPAKPAAGVLLENVGPNLMQQPLLAAVKMEAALATPAAGPTVENVVESSFDPFTQLAGDWSPQPRGASLAGDPKFVAGTQQLQLQAALPDSMDSTCSAAAASIVAKTAAEAADVDLAVSVTDVRQLDHAAADVMPSAAVDELAAVVQGQHLLRDMVLQLAGRMSAAVQELSDCITTMQQQQPPSMDVVVCPAREEDQQQLQELQVKLASPAVQVAGLNTKQDQQAPVAVPVAVPETVCVGFAPAPAVEVTEALELQCSSTSHLASAAVGTAATPAQGLQQAQDCLAQLSDQVATLQQQQATVQLQLQEQQHGMSVHMDAFKTESVEFRELCGKQAVDVAALGAKVASLQEMLMMTQQQNTSSSLPAEVAALQQEQQALQQQLQALQEQLEQHHHQQSSQPAMGDNQGCKEEQCFADVEEAACRSASCTESFMTAASFSRAASSVSPGLPALGVLHAPLSLVVQLQQELAALRDGQISREQFAAVVRMVKDLRRRSSSTDSSTPLTSAASGSSKCVPFATATAAASSMAVETQTCNTAPAATDAEATDKSSPFASYAAASLDASQSVEEAVKAELQQHTERLVVLEQGLQSLMMRLESDEPLAAMQSAVNRLQDQQQLAACAGAEQQQLLERRMNEVHDAAEKQAAALSALIASTEHDLSNQQGSLRNDLASLCSVVDDLAAKLATAAAAAAQSQRQFSGYMHDAASSSFSDMVAGLANLKVLLDQQGKTLMTLQERVELQDFAVSELAAAAQARAAAAAAVVDGLDECLDRRLSSSAAGKLNADSSSIDAADGAAATNLSDANVLSQQVAYVSSRLAELEGQMSFNLQQQTMLLQAQSSVVMAAGPAGAAAPASAAEGAAAPVPSLTALAACSSTSSSRRVSRACSISGADAVEVVVAAAGEATAAVAGPMGLVHQILKELKARVDKLEGSAAVAAAAAATCGPAASAIERKGVAPGSVPSTPGRGNTGIRRGAAWLQPMSDGATLSELQELVERLQSDVAQIAEENSTFAGKMNALQGDVGAAAEAAAAAAAAAQASHELSRLAVPVTTLSGSGAAAPRSLEWSSSLTSYKEAAVTGVAAEATQAVLQAQAAANKAQTGLADLSEELQQVKQQLAALCQPGVAVADMETAAAGVGGAGSDAVATKGELGMLQTEVTGLRLLLQDHCNSSQTCTLCAEHGEQPATATAAQPTQPCSAELLEQAASRAAAAAAVATEAVVQEVKTQLADMQHQLSELVCDGQLLRQLTFALPASRASVGSVSEVPAASFEAAAAVAAAVEAVQDKAAGSSTAAATAGPASLTGDDTSSAAGCVGGCRQSLSFSELSIARNPSDHALTRQLWLTAATETAGGKPLDLTSDSSAWFEHVFDDVDSQQQHQHQQQMPSPTEGYASNVTNTAAAGVAARDSTADTTNSVASITPTKQLLADQLVLLSPAHQVAFLSKLASVVSAHAGRLLATYQDDAEHSSQLRQVQEQLASAVARLSSSSSSSSAASAPATTGGSSSSSRNAVMQYARSSSMGMLQAASGVATAGGGRAADVLLGILDQVAALRAIGSATHPAITQTLEKHEAAIAALWQAVKEQQQQHKHLDVAPAAAAALEGAAGAATTSEVAETCSSISGAATVGPAAAGSGSSTLAAASAGGADGEAYAGEYGQRLSLLEAKLSAGLRVLSGLRDRLGPLQEVADATQSMMRELQVAHGLVLQRLVGLEGLAAGAAAAEAAAAGDDDCASGVHAGEVAEARKGVAAGGGVLAVAGSIQALKDDLLQLSRRLSSAEAKLAATSECLALGRRVAARQADTDSRMASLAGKVSGVAGSMPQLVDKVAVLESRLLHSLNIARRGLDILADQLVALGALNGRASPTKNPLAALGPNHAAITALESKLEAVRTAMMASVKLMMQDLAADAAAAGAPVRATPGLAAPDLGSALLATQLAASEAANAATASHTDALNGLEGRLAELKAELQLALADALQKAQQPQC